MDALLCSQERVLFLLSESNTFLDAKSKWAHMCLQTPMSCQSSAGKMQIPDRCLEGPARSEPCLPHYPCLGHSSHTHSATLASLNSKRANLLSILCLLYMLLPCLGVFPTLPLSFSHFKLPFKCNFSERIVVPPYHLNYIPNIVLFHRMLDLAP